MDHQPISCQILLFCDFNYFRNCLNSNFISFKTKLIIRKTSNFPVDYIFYAQALCPLCLKHKWDGKKMDH